MSKKRGVTDYGWSADSARYAAWQKHDLPTIILTWMLYKGGIWDFKRIQELIGRPVHASLLQSMVDGADRLLQGPHQLTEPVRCNGCGAKIIQIPCTRCARPLTGVGRFRDIKPNPSGNESNT